MIHAGLPRNMTSTSIFHEKDRETDGSQDLESQQGITKTTQVETSISGGTDFQEENAFHLEENLGPFKRGVAEGSAFVLG